MLTNGTHLSDSSAVPHPYEDVPVVQWLSEAVQLQFQASFDSLRARLRLARERLRDGRGATLGYAPLTTLLATDLEGFTAMLERLGDARAQELMHAHNEILRSCLRRHHGREVYHAGDGVLASFRSPVHALRCAVAMQRRFQAYNLDHPGTPLRIRIGIHAGVPLPEEDRLFGTCVNVTVRVCGVAKPGSILATKLVLGLLEGQVSFRFLDRGAVALKGISVPQALHELVWQCQPVPALREVLN
jgi:class 3 adenylate cyclase